MDILLANQSPEKFFTYPFHRHGYWEILLNLSGEGTATIDGIDYPFRKGTIFCIPKGVLHRKVSAEGFTDGCLFVRDYAPVDSRPVAQFEDDPAGSFHTLFRMILDLQAKGGPNTAATIRAIGDALHQLLVGWNMRRPDWCTTIEAFQNLLLDEVPNAGFDLAAAVRDTGYSDSHFRKLFLKQTGLPPLQYLLHLRIEHAKRQLHLYHEVRSIKETAYACGFSDPYYFSRMFRKQTGDSPEAYVAGLGTFDRSLVETERQT